MEKLISPPLKCIALHPTAFLADTGAKLPSKLAPLRTLPAVDISRGSEGALPNGMASVDFAAGVLELASLLAREPRIVMEVWHKERCVGAF